MSRVIDNIANVVIIVTGVLLISVFGFRYLAPLFTPEPDLTEYRASSAITGTISSLTLSDDLTILVVVRSDCRFCNDSAGFYRDILALRKHDGPRSLDVRFVSVRDESDARAFIDKHSFKEATVEQMPPDFKERLRSTPTLLFVGRDGTIRRSWIGTLTPSERRAVLADLVGSSSTATQR